MRKITIAALGLAVAALPATTAWADAPTKLRICAGSPTGNYTFAAKEIQKRLGNAFAEVEIVTTGGSLDNMRRLTAGECDMAFAQSDVADLFVLENPASLSTIEPFKIIYQEYVHLLCPTASGWDGISDLGAGSKIVVGPDGGGSAETWRSLRRANDEKYAKIERLADPVNVTSASTVKDSANTCMMWVSGLNSADMQAVNLISVNTRDRKPALRLVDIDDDAMGDILGSDGKPLYRWAEITRVEPKTDKKGLPQGGVYANLIPGGWFGGSVSVPVVDAKLMVRSDFKAAAASVLPRVTLAIEDASPTIWNRVNPASQQ